MLLCALPVEILRQIIVETVPEGLEGVISSCKHLYKIGEPLLPRHRHMKRLYRDLRFPKLNIPLDDAVQRPMELLHRVAKDPLIARYVETADFEQYEFYADPDSPVFKLAASDGHIYQLLHDSPYLKEAGQVPATWLVEGDDLNDRFHYFNDHAITTILLTMLPNIRQLSLSRHWSGFFNSQFDNDRRGRDIWSVLDVLVEKANRNSGVPTDAPLSKLEEIVLRDDTWSYASCQPQAYIPFLSIKSIQAFGVENLLTENPQNLSIGRPISPVYGEIGRNLTFLALARACIDIDTISVLLEHMFCLKTLKFSYDDKSILSRRLPAWGYFVTSKWNATAFMATIERHVGPTLEELSISVSCNVTELYTAVKSMEGFTKLKRLAIDSRIIIPRTSQRQQSLDPLDEQLEDTGQPFDDTAPQAEGASQSVADTNQILKGTKPQPPDLDGSTLLPLPVLSKILPRQLETLAFLTDSWDFNLIVRNHVCEVSLNLIAGLLEEFGKSNEANPRSLDRLQILGIPDNEDIHPIFERLKKSAMELGLTVIEGWQFEWDAAHRLKQW